MARKIADLRPGDIFCSTENGSVVARAIRSVQRLWSVDNEASYSHSGIILNADGETFEALWKVKRRNIFKDFYGCKLIIGRHVLMTEQKFTECMNGIKKYEGRIYPAYRILLHMIPFLAKTISVGDFLVCSELAFKFLYSGKLVDYYKGVAPDHIADAIRRWDDFVIVDEIVCSEKTLP